MQYLLLTLLSMLIGWIVAWDAYAADAVRALENQVVEYRLSNGMQWLLVRKEGAPVFTGVVQIKVGGIEETPGKSGLAHMFEHMAFKGTKEIGTKDYQKEAALLAKIRAMERHAASASDQQLKVLSESARQYVLSNEIWHLFHRNGAEELNAFTGKDMTAYYARMPVNAMGLWMYLTAEMVGRPVLREFYQERSVVMEERRSSTDASPRGTLYEALMQTAYTDSPYRSMTIGSMEDLQQLRLRDAETFHLQYYRPDRMVGAVVGYIDIAATKKLIQRFFGPAPAQKSPPLFESHVEARGLHLESFQTPAGERRVRVAFAAEPAVMLAYHKPSLPHRDDYVFDLLVGILCDGMTSRLERRLVQTDRVAREIDCSSGSPGGRLPNLFLIDAQPIAPYAVTDIVRIVDEELAALRTDLVDAAELEKARLNIRADFLWGIATNEGLAQQLAYFQTIAGDWRYILRHGEILQQITPEEIRAVAAKYLVPANRTVAELVKK